MYFAVHTNNNIESPSAGGSIFAERSGFFEYQCITSTKQLVSGSVTVPSLPAKPRTSLFSCSLPWLSEHYDVLPWTPLILKKGSAARINLVVTVDIYTPCFPVTFFLKSRTPTTPQGFHSPSPSTVPFLDFVKMAGDNQQPSGRISFSL